MSRKCCQKGSAQNRHAQGRSDRKTDEDKYSDRKIAEDKCSDMKIAEDRCSEGKIADDTCSDRKIAYDGKAIRRSLERERETEKSCTFFKDDCINTVAYISNTTG